MNSEWKSLLTRMNAVLNDERVSHFGNPAQELRAALGGNILCDLSSQGLIAAHGPDTEQFLQGQATSDVRQVTPEHSQLSGYCSPKGRMLASFRIFRRNDGYYLRLPKPLVEPTLQRLRMFVLRTRTALEDASDALVGIGLSGPDTEALLQRALEKTPHQVDEVIQAEGITVIRLPGLHPRFEIYGEPEDMEALWSHLAAQSTLVGEEPWRLLDILVGIPTIYPETSDVFLPQMVNLQLLGGVSFKKGCYTGQEVVARTQHLGRLKRRMYRAHVDSATAPPPGAELFSPQTAPSQSAGRVVDAARHPDGGYEMLAVVLIDCAEGSTVLLGDAKGPRLRFEPLPYAFADAGA